MNNFHEKLEKIRYICQKRNLRLTSLREKVLTIIWGTSGACKAYAILKELQPESINPHPPTVYRALDFLLENKFIHKLSTVNAYVACPNLIKHSICCFLICRYCGDIQEYGNHSLKKSLQNIADENEFNFQGSSLEIQGKCKNC